jgi:transposase
MAKRSFHITQEQERELQQAFETTKDGATRTRIQAVRMYGLQYKVEEIQRLTGCAWSSLMDWCRAYRGQGIDGLRDHRRGGNRAKLSTEQQETVQARLLRYGPRDLLGPHTQTATGQHWTVEDLAQAVQRWYGITWESRTSYHSLFARCGFTYQCTEKVYKSRRERDVAEFEAQVEKN